MKSIAARGGVAENTSSRLHAPLTGLTTSLDRTRPGFFCESSQLLFQILPHDLRVHIKPNMRFTSVSCQDLACAPSSCKPAKMSNTKLRFSPSFLQSISKTSRSHNLLVSALMSRRGRTVLAHSSSYGTLTRRVVVLTCIGSS